MASTDFQNSNMLRTKLEELYSNRLLDVDAEPIEYAKIIKNVIELLSDCASLTLNIYKQQYVGKKTRQGTDFLHQKYTEPDLSSPRNKGVTLVKQIPDLRFVDQYFEEMYPSFTEKERANVASFRAMIDDPSFIKAFYHYVRAAMYSFAIRTIDLNAFNKFVIETVNERIRPDYMVQRCKTCKDETSLCNPADYSGSEGFDGMKEETYLCGRGIGYITTPGKTTRLVMFNTISTENDNMDEDWFNDIKDGISGGRKRRWTNFGRRKSRRRKTKRRHRF